MIARIRHFDVQPQMLWILLILSVVTSAYAGRAVALDSRLPLLMVASMAGLVFFALPLTQMAVVAIFITTATYRGAFLAVRFNFAGFELGPYDVLWLAVLARVIWTWYTSEARSLDPPIMAFVVSISAMVVVGRIVGQDPYNISKFLRTGLFLLAGYGVVHYVSLPGRLAVVRALVLGGAATALLQILTFGFALQGINVWSRLGISVEEKPDVFTVTAEVTSSFRDNSVTIYFAIVSAIILLVSFLMDRLLFSRMITAVLLTTTMVGVVLSLTRGAWLSLAVGVVFAVLASRRLNLSMALKLVVVGVVSTTAFAVAVSLFVPNLDLVSTVLETRFSSVEGGRDDQTVSDRLLETQTALDVLGRNWIVGVGATEVELVQTTPWGAIEVAVRNQLHNGYMQYLLAGGLFGLFSLLWLVFRSVATSWHASRQVQQTPYVFVSAASFSALVAILGAAVTGGIINDSFQTPVVGALLAITAFAHSKPLELEQNGVAPKLAEYDTW